jgi:hypothetical protein
VSCNWLSLGIQVASDEESVAELESDMQDRITAQVHMCDYASVADSKLTMVGAGFDFINLQADVAPVVFGVGVFLHIPWGQTNTQHSWSFVLLDGDGRPHHDPAGNEIRYIETFEVGRPPGVTPGSSLTRGCAINFPGLPLAAGKTYVAQVYIGDKPTASARFQTRLVATTAV